METYASNNKTIFFMKRRILARKDLGGKRTPPAGIRLQAFIAGTDRTVLIVDVHFGDDTLCYLDGANGVATKIDTLEIEVKEPHERGQGRKRVELPKVNVTYRIDQDLAKWLSSQRRPTRAFEAMIKRAMNGDEKIISKAFRAGAKIALRGYMITNDDIESALDDYLYQC